MRRSLFLVVCLVFLYGCGADDLGGLAEPSLAETEAKVLDDGGARIMAASTSLGRTGDEKLLRVDTFESGVIDYDQVQSGGTYDGTYWTSGNHIGPWRVIESKVPARAGGRYIKSSIGTQIAAMSGANNRYRTELVDPTRKRIMRTNWLGEENWVGFSVYLPSAEFKKRSGGSEWDRDIIFQWHEVDRSENRVAFMIGTDYRNGVMQWRLEQGWQGGGAKPWLDATAHPVVLDRWTDWVMNVKWDHRVAGNGFMKVWKDGKLVLDYKGPTMYDHVNGPIWKLGLYKGWWRDGTHPEQAEPIRSVYHDEFRIGGATASYAMVAPGGTSSTTEPAPSPSAPALPAGAIEAEAGTLTSPMAKVASSEAAGGAYIETSQNEYGSASYTFNVGTAGIYKIVGRVFASGTGSDSFYVRLNDGTEFIWDLNPTAAASEFGAWREDAVTHRGSGTYSAPQFDPYTVELAAGNHTIVIRGRESRTRLDYVRLVKVADLHPDSVEPTEPVDTAPPVDQTLATVHAIDYIQKGKHLDIVVLATDGTGNPLPGVDLALTVTNPNVGTSLHRVTTNGDGQGTVNNKFPLPGCYSTFVQDARISGYLWDGATPANELCL